MSAWAIFSMMGFYPDCPGKAEYTLTTPRFDSIEIRLAPEYCEGENKLVIKCSVKGGLLEFRCL